MIPKLVMWIYLLWLSNMSLLFLVNYVYLGKII